MALADEVTRQVEPDEEDEAADVVEQVPNVVALIADGGRKVVGSIPFYVMVADCEDVSGGNGRGAERDGWAYRDGRSRCSRYGRTEDR